MSPPNDTTSVARRRLSDINEHLQILAADAGLQNAWLHPCGWTREKPFVHIDDRPPCMPIGELRDALDDMLPSWWPVLEPVLTPSLEDALNRLSARFKAFDSAAFADELDTLDRPEWSEIRRLASEAARLTDAILIAERTRRQVRGLRGGPTGDSRTH